MSFFFSFLLSFMSFDATILRGLIELINNNSETWWKKEVDDRDSLVLDDGWDDCSLVIIL